jgi:hypothetical protein
MSASTTAAPASAKALAVARPMPEPAPVTSATLFSKGKFINEFLLVESLLVTHEVSQTHLLLFSGYSFLKKSPACAASAEKHVLYLKVIVDAPSH